MDGFTHNPVPYPVLLILSLMLLFLAISCYFSCKEVLEVAEEQLGWMLSATPLLLILIVRWLSSVDTSERFFFKSSPWERRRTTHQLPSEGTSPWGVAAFILLVLLLLHYQSTFLYAWFLWFYFVFSSEFLCCLFSQPLFHSITYLRIKDVATLIQVSWLLYIQVHE